MTDIARCKKQAHSQLTDNAKHELSRTGALPQRSQQWTWNSREYQPADIDWLSINQ
jgi:hypothetical protein